MKMRNNNTDFYHPKNYRFFENAAQITTKVTSIIFDKTFDGVDLFSLNIPFDATTETPLAITTLFKTRYGRLFYKKGKKFIHRTPPVEFKNMEDYSDLRALYDNKISLTPMNISFATQQSHDNVQHVFKEKW
jgi:broad specificity polyphosphatase/5'/3'-nucleotidase SurE